MVQYAHSSFVSWYGIQGRYGGRSLVGLVFEATAEIFLQDPAGRSRYALAHYIIA